MKTIILYASKGGNTKKIAQSVASELGCEALAITPDGGLPALDSYDLVFVGTGIYAGNPIAEVEKYLLTADLGKPKQIALFITWGGAGKTREMVAEKLRKILESKGHRIVGQVFSCYGGSKFSFLKRGHPNNQDLEAAAKWAKEVVSNQQK
jgi:flavodoxin